MKTLNFTSPPVNTIPLLKSERQGSTVSKEVIEVTE